jgi:hypothetical protein
MIYYTFNIFAFKDFVHRIFFLSHNCIFLIKIVDKIGLEIVVDEMELLMKLIQLSIKFVDSF